MCQLLKQSTAVTVKMGPFVDDTDGKTFETSLSIAQADVRLSKNGGNYAQKADTGTASYDENGDYDVALNTTDTGTLGRLRASISKSGALPVWKEFIVVPANVYDALVGGSDKLQVDSVEISSSTTAADNVEANINNLNAPVQTVDTVVDAIKAVTDNLPDSGALNDLATLVGRLTAARAGYLDNLSGGAVALASALTVVDTVVDAIKAVTDNLPDAGALSDLATLAGRLTAARAAYLDKLNISGNVFGDAAMAELTGTPPASPTPAQALMLEYMRLRNTLTSGGSSPNEKLKIRNAAGTVITEAEEEYDGTTFTKGQLGNP